jgi:hypothetical protein
MFEILYISIEMLKYIIGFDCKIEKENFPEANLLFDNGITSKIQIQEDILNHNTYVFINLNDGYKDVWEKIKFDTIHNDHYNVIRKELERIVKNFMAY